VTFNILICDDEFDRAKRLRDFLNQASFKSIDLNCVAVPPSEFTSTIVDLERRRRHARERGADEGGTVTGPDMSPNLFDQGDIIFLDYDLVRLEDEDAAVAGSQSGERIAYLARCYSRCGIIVGYNQFYYKKTFDLTLRGNLRSFADLNISYDVVAHPGLWGGGYDDFRPWYWPLLPHAVTRMHECRKQLEDGNADASILNMLGLTSAPVRNALVREQLEFLTPGEHPESTTFRGFVVDSGQGLKKKDALWEPQAVARIGAARISKWLERSILPGQNILVDAPHLVDRFPSLLTSDGDTSGKNSTCHLGLEASELGLDSEKIVSAQFSSSAWLSRPTWIWPTLAQKEDIAEVRDPWGAPTDSLVFCEDSSRFCEREEAKEFVAEVRSEFSRRHVRKFDDVNYEPAVRFLM